MQIATSNQAEILAYNQKPLKISLKPYFLPAILFGVSQFKGRAKWNLV